MIEIEGAPDGGAASRAVSMSVAQACGLGGILNRFRKSLMTNGRDAEIANELHGRFLNVLRSHPGCVVLSVMCVQLCAMFNSLMCQYCSMVVSDAYNMSVTFV